MASYFPSLKPKVSNTLWFLSESNTTIDDEVDLAKEETKYNEQLKKEVNEGHDITPIGKTKEKNEDLGNFSLETFTIAKV